MRMRLSAATARPSSVGAVRRTAWAARSRPERGAIQDADRSGSQGNWKYCVYQLRIACLGSNAASERRTPAPRLGRNAATGGTDTITALANHQRADVIAAVRGDRRRRVAAHERRRHPPPRVGQQRRDRAPAVCGIGETVQDTRQSARQPAPRSVPAAAPRGSRRRSARRGPYTGSNLEISQRPSTLSSATRTLDAVSVGVSVPTTTLWFTYSRTTA